MARRVWAALTLALAAAALAAPAQACTASEDGARLSVECKDSLTDTVTYNGQDVAWSAFVDGLASDNAITEASFLLDGVTLSKGADVIAILDVTAGLAAAGRAVNTTLRRCSMTGVYVLAHRAYSLPDGGGISLTLDACSIQTNNIIALLALGAKGKLTLGLTLSATDISSNLLAFAGAVGVVGDADVVLNIGGGSSLSRNKVIGVGAAAVTGTASVSAIVGDLTISSNRGRVWAAGGTGREVSLNVDPVGSVSVEDQEDCESGSSYSGYSYSYCDDLFQLQVGGGSDIPMVADAGAVLIPSLMDLADAFNNGNMTLDKLVGNMQRPNFLTLLFGLVSTALDVVFGVVSAATLLTTSTFSNVANMVSTLLAAA